MCAQRDRAGRPRHERRLRRQRHAERLLRRPAERDAAALRGARLELGAAVHERRQGDGLRRRRGRRRPLGPGLARERRAVARGRAAHRHDPPRRPRGDRRARAVQLGRGHRLQPRGRAVRIRQLPDRDRRARRRHPAAGRQLRARAPTTRRATAASTSSAPTRCTAAGPGPRRRSRPRTRQTPEGERAIFRVPIRTQPRATICTAHVFHQIPGQNRIVMAWYSQGTHIIDFLERPDGTIEFKEAGYFIPENANEWVSAAFKSEDERRRHPDALRRHRRLQPRRGGPQRDRRLEGHAAARPGSRPRSRRRRGPDRRSGGGGGGGGGRGRSRLLERDPRRQGRRVPGRDQLRRHDPRRRRQGQDQRRPRRRLRLRRQGQGQRQGRGRETTRSRAARAPTARTAGPATT